LGGSDRTRLGICAAPRCGRFFLAARPKQVWCTRACGNRARVARHYARTRA
ncbi:MAG: CGNR zinc finger domain-containing protein, partial [Actinobacteria bacterium]|nr:CGNR zinc finger domain-containing protein [Actinomycetota bacterium]